MKILVTAGPTREKIDPVRFISNYSTGTFGYEIAGEAARRGHDVTLVSGPTSLEAPKGVRIVMVESALDMRREVQKRARSAGCVIMAAAVCDWRARSPLREKTKRHPSASSGWRPESIEGRQGRGITLQLNENPDILKELGNDKKGILVGFALETENLENNALAKLKNKNLDLIVANRLTKKRGLFGAGLTDVLMIDSLYRKDIYRRRTKKALAKIILDKVSNFKI